MKKTLFIHIVLLLFAASCSLLEESPEDFFSEENFYVTEQDAIAAVNAAYRPLAASPGPDNGVYNDCIWILGDLASDNTTNGPDDTNLGRNQIENFNFDENSGVFFRVWSAAYDGINKSNIVLDNVPDIVFANQGRKDAVLGQAYFLRALYYFNLVRLFGDVPLILASFTGLGQEQQPQRDDASAVYGQIVDDLEMAEQLLPLQWDGEDLGRASQGAATALLAKVYLTRQDWGNAALKAQQVVDSRVYALFDTYREAFLSSQTLVPEHNENGIESIFEVQMRSNQELRNRLVRSLAPRNSFIINSGRSPGSGLYVPTQEFYDAHQDTDQRKAWNFLTEYVGPNGDTVRVVPHFNKYRDPGMGSSSSSNNYYVLRYADVLLMLAEATNEASGPTAEAYDAINQVRNRSGLPDLAEGLGQAEFRDAVLNERHLEFAWEGHRWFDLARTGRLVEVLQAQGINAQPFHTLYPIPQRERDLNPNLSQNDGY